MTVAAAVARRAACGVRASDAPTTPPMPAPRPPRPSALLAALLLAVPAALAAQPAVPSDAPSAAPAATPADAPATVDAAARRRIVDSVASVLAERYVDSTVARRLAETVRGRLAAGAYDAYADALAFGAALMRDLQSVVQDKHLRIAYLPQRDFALGGPRVVRVGAPGGAPAAGAAGPVRRWTRPDPRDSVQVARTNFAFERVERLDGNVGYLRVERFVPLDWSRGTAAAAMAFLANSDAVILDLRGNPGGSPDLVELLLSYFAPAEPMSLVTVYNRAANVTIEHRTHAEVPGRRLTGVPLYVLQDARSASSAEMLAYMVRQHRLGTVVGETSSGAGNGGANLSVGAGLALFVPEMRVTSGPGFERTGVEPDVRTPGDSALLVAHRLAREAIAARAAPSAPAAPATTPTVSPVTYEAPATAAPDDLAALSDEFASAASLGRWTQFHEAEKWPSMIRRVEVRRGGELYLEPHTSGWYADFHAPFMYKEVTGDFVVTARLRADGIDGGVPTSQWSLAGLMARAPRTVTRETWTPNGENWVFVTAGVAEEPGVPVFETKTTVNSRSRLRLHPARAGWVELRITRVGAAVELATRADGEDWVVRDRFDRPDLPAMLQVGLNAYTDWYHARSMHDDPRRFNTTVLTDGTPDMGLRVDWVRFTRPAAAPR